MQQFPSIKLIPRICALITLVIGGLIVIGHLANIDLLKTPMQTMVAAKFNSGICIFLCGMILLAANAEKKNTFILIVYYSFSGLVLLTSVLTLAEYLSHKELGIDLLMTTQKNQEGCPTGMSFFVSISLVITSLCFLLLEKASKALANILLWGAGSVFFFSLFLVFTYLFKATIPANCYNYSSISLYSAVGIVFISFGLIASHEFKPMEILYGKNVGGLTARKILIPVFIILPLIFFLRVTGETALYYNTGYGSAFMTILILILFTIVVIRVCSQLNTKAKQLIKSEGQFRSFVENVQEYSIFMLDKEGHITSWNDSAKRIKGYSGEEIIGKHFSVFYTKEEKDNDEPSYNLKMAKEKGHYETEGWRVRKDGSQFMADIVLTALYDPDGELSGFVKITRDITARRKAEEEKNKLLILHQKHKELENFTYILTHDVLAPIRNVSILSQWFVEGYIDKVDEQGKEWLRLMNEKITLLGKMIDEVLVYLRAGRTKPEKTQLDLNAVLNDIIKLHYMPDKRKIMLDTKLPVIFASKTDIKQIFTNLIDNAIKHNDKPIALINIGCTEENDFWKFYVKDNGPCMPKQYHEKVFEIFQTLKSKDETQSTGIGLATVKRNIENEGGKIWIENGEVTGCAFFFTVKK